MMNKKVFCQVPVWESFLPWDFKEKNPALMGVRNQTPVIFLHLTHRFNKSPYNFWTVFFSLHLELLGTLKEG